VPENDTAPSPAVHSRRSGILLVDKPAGFTSHDVVARTRRLAGTRKVGHAGTLDPMATGLLILGLNSSTRLLTYLVGLDKEYLATIRLGASTTTDDAEGEQTASASPDAVAALTDAALHEQLARLTGAIQQVPSSVSAIKVGGQRAYARVRAGEEFQLPARPVTVFALELLDQRREPAHLDLDVRVACSSGTYVRALARDLGAALGVGGHLVALRRTRIGPFRVADAAVLEDLDVASRLVDPAAVASALFPSVQLSSDQVVDLVHGKKILVPDIASADAGPVAALAPDGRLVGLVTVFGGTAKPLANFPTDEVLP
jgi:tRNA pseudouridine55 synthase